MRSAAQRAAQLKAAKASAAKRRKSKPLNKSQRADEIEVAKKRAAYFDKQSALKGMRGKGARYSTGKLKNPPVTNYSRQLLGDGRFTGLKSKRID